MRNAVLDEARAGIKIAGRNTSYLRYADNTTILAESVEKLKSSLLFLWPSYPTSQNLHMTALGLRRETVVPLFQSELPHI